MTIKKTFCFDIDGVIMSLVPDNDYKKSEPILETVDLINKLYDSGHHIIIFTARGYVTKKDWKEVTMKQFEKCNLKYHELIFGKPAADYYIDDKMIDINELSNLLNSKNV